MEAPHVHQKNQPDQVFGRLFPAFWRNAQQKQSLGHISRYDPLVRFRGCLCQELQTLQQGRGSTICPSSSGNVDIANQDETGGCRSTLASNGKSIPPVFPWV